MQQRAEQNKHFVFIKIPELPVNLSYKGKKEKNIEDVHNSRLVVPTLEYHSVTWTWLDLLLAIKAGSKSALVSQVWFLPNVFHLDFYYLLAKGAFHLSVWLYIKTLLFWLLLILLWLLLIRIFYSRYS